MSFIFAAGGGGLAVCGALQKPERSKEWIRAALLKPWFTKQPTEQDWADYTEAMTIELKRLTPPKDRPASPPNNNPENASLSGP